MAIVTAIEEREAHRKLLRAVRWQLAAYDLPGGAITMVFTGSDA